MIIEIPLFQNWKFQNFSVFLLCFRNNFETYLKCFHFELSKTMPEMKFWSLFTMANIMLKISICPLIFQVQASLAPPSADPYGTWHDCKMNHARCSASQIQFLQGFFPIKQKLLEPGFKLPVMNLLSYSHIFFILWRRLQESYAEFNKSLLYVQTKRAVYKFMFCSLPVREAGYMVFW